MYGVYNENTGEYENLETNQSICPVGWTLPYAFYNENTDQYGGDLASLWSEYGWNGYLFSDISNIWSEPLYFAPVGGFEGNFKYTSRLADWWSFVAYNSYYAHDAYFDIDGYANPAEESFRGSGDSVRCLLR